LTGKRPFAIHWPSEIEYLSLDTEPFREAGWDDEAICHTVIVCPLFNF
jgi:hypothetical protein